MDAVVPETVVSDDLLAEYREKGFILVQSIFSADEVAQMRAALNGLVAGAAGVKTHDELYDLEPIHTPENPKVRRIKDPFLAHPAFNEMARRPRLIAALTRLLGPDLRLHGSKINLKTAAYGSPVEWHQDWAFYPHTNDDVLAVGVMLDDMTAENGPLMVVPGSHRGPTHNHHQDGRFVGGIDIDAEDVDVSAAEQIIGKAGDCSFHHVRAIHGSAQNTSGRDRRLLLYQVAAGDAWEISGMTDTDAWDKYASTFIAGAPTNQPRLVPTPIRLPQPGPVRTGSIYESQTLLKNKKFGDDA